MMITEKIDNFGAEHVKKYSELYVGILAAIIRSAIADYELQRGDISQDMDLLSAIIRATIADYESRRNPQDVEHLTAEIAELRRNLDIAKASIQVIIADYESRRNPQDVEHLTAEIAELRRNLDAANAQIEKEDELNSEIQELRHTLDEAHSSISELHMQIASLDADNAALIRSNRELNDALQMMRHQYEMPSPSATSAPAPIESAEDDCVERLTAQIAELRCNLDIMLYGMPYGNDANALIEKQDKLITELHMQIASLDADNAALIRSNRELNDALQMMRHEMQSPATSAPAPIESAEDDCVDWIIGLKAQRHAWRHVPKAMQLRIVRHALDEMNPAGSTSQSEFNARRPFWMPTATTLCATLHMQWSAINDANATLPVGAQ